MLGITLVKATLYKEAKEYIEKSRNIGPQTRLKYQNCMFINSMTKHFLDKSPSLLKHEKQFQLI